MPYLLDTDIVIDHLLEAGGTLLESTLEAMAGDELAMSVITYMEAYEGSRDADDRRRLGSRLARLVDAVPVIPFTKKIARRCARLRGMLRRKRKRVRGRALDLLIAATAIDGGYTLVTRNRDDYQDIPGLKLYDKGEVGER